MGISVITAFLTKLSEFRGLEVEIFVEVWFWLYGATLMANDNLLRTPNMKRDSTKCDSDFKWQTGGK